MYLMPRPRSAVRARCAGGSGHQPVHARVRAGLHRGQPRAGWLHQLAQPGRVLRVVKGEEQQRVGWRAYVRHPTPPDLCRLFRH